MKVALVHDYLIRFGGAERVLLNLKKIFKKAPVYTLLYNEKEMGRYFKGIDIRTSFLQKFPLSCKYHRLLAPFIPSAVESFDLKEFDLVISSSSAFIKGLILRPKTLHICYCHNPSRFLWDYAHQYDGGLSFWSKILFHYLRVWDKSSASRVDYFIANSKATARRIKKFYGREAKIIYPSVMMAGSGYCNNLDPGEKSEGSRMNTAGFSTKDQNNNPGKDYFLVVSQLTPYKKIDLAIDAFNKLELPLVIIGDGRDRKRLQKMANKNIKFLGWQTDEVVKEYFKNCLAFIFPGEDDFGIAPVEAMSCGKPVLAYRKGGATETIIESITGEFFDDLAPEAIADGVRRIKMNFGNYSPLVIRKRAEKFSQERFEIAIKELVVEILEEKKREF